MKKLITVVTLNFNTSNETHQFLTSMFKVNCKDFDLKIIIVDNGSKEKFVLTTDEEKQDVTLIRSEENLGFSGGNNLGFNRAFEVKSDYILVINNDTYHDNNFLSEMFKIIEKSQKIGMVAPKI